MALCSTLNVPTCPVGMTDDPSGGALPAIWKRNTLDTIALQIQRL